MDTVLLALASAAFATGGVCMKLSDGLTRLWPTTGVFALFCAGAALQTVAMRRADLSVAYILVLGGEAVLTLVFSTLVLGERCSPARIAAAGLIVAGMVWLRRT
jgi:small multidrug resistance pump/quaternary ammonium compound-resistance protein SugE